MCVYETNLRRLCVQSSANDYFLHHHRGTSHVIPDSGYIFGAENGEKHCQTNSRRQFYDHLTYDRDHPATKNVLAMTNGEGPDKSPVSVRLNFVVF